MTTKQYLSQFLRTNQLIDGDLAEIFRLRTLAQSITVVQKDVNVQSSGDKDKLGAAVSKIADLEQEIDEKIEIMKVQRDLIVDQIKDLDSMIEFRVLYDRYIRNMTYEKIADDIGCSLRHTHRVHGEALLSFERKYGEFYLKN